MGAYYYLVSGLPEIKLSDTKAKYDIKSISENILLSLNSKDAFVFKYFLYQNDNKNLVSSIAKSKGLFSPYNDFIEPAIFSKEDLQKPENVSSLPSYIIRFLEDYKNTEWESARHIENTLLNLYYEEMFNLGNKFMASYASFMRDLKNILAALNARSLGFNVEAISKELIGDYSLISSLTKSTAPDFGLGREMPYINDIIETFNSSDKSDPYHIESIESSLVKDFLDKETSIKSFMTENVFAYYINLSYAVNINLRNEEEGKKYLETLVESLKSEVSII